MTWMAEYRERDARRQRVEQEAQARRDLNPHKSAVAAMFMYGAEYSRQRGGSMTFWDGLDELRKDVCRSLVKRVSEAPDESGHTQKEGET